MDIVLLTGLIAALLLLSLAGFVLYQLVVQSGRILNRLDSLESWAASWSGELQYGIDQEPEVEEYTGMLPLGVPAPPFSLPDLNGTNRSLSEWRGRRLLLVFFDPESSFCQRLLPLLAALRLDVVQGRPMPLIVTTGDLDTNRRLFDGSEFDGPVLLQREMEVASAYKVDATPMSYLIEADGSIASGLAVGIQATLILAGEMPDDGADPALHRPPGHEERRSGLSVGSTAPVFRLPRVHGGELSLLEYRGRPVVVVFTDVDCEPCDRLAPLLLETHRREPTLAIVIVGRGELAKNRAKVEQLGLPFPVVLQRHWEVSREYGILAAPVAYGIDEWGTIASEAAVGPDAIIAMINSFTKAVPGRA